MTVPASEVIEALNTLMEYEAKLSLMKEGHSICDHCKYQGTKGNAENSLCFTCPFNEDIDKNLDSLRAVLPLIKTMELVV